MFDKHKIQAVSPTEEPPLSRTLLEFYKRPCLQATLLGRSGTFSELYKRSCCDIFSTATLSFSTAIVEAVIVATAVAAYVALLSLLLSSSLL